MELRVLGPMEAWIDGRNVAVGRAQHRGVLAALLVDVGQVVSTGVIIDRVWGGEASAGASSGLQAIISRLRNSLGREVILTHAPGYRLAVDRADVDAVVFADRMARVRELVARGAAREAKATVAQALALWRADAYLDVPFEFAAREAAALSEHRVAAIELAVEVDLTLGLHQELVQRLPALVRDHPLREGLRASLMLALYRCGRQGEALRAFHSGRQLLLDELGVDPGPELQRLHGLILRQDPGLAGPGSGPAGPVAAGAAEENPGAAHNLTASLTPMIGREDQLAAVSSMLSGSRLVTIVGTGGIGKTRLALEIAERRRDDDGPWLVELAALRDGALVVETIATAVGVTGPGGLAGLTSVLRERRLMLVLDNCEQIAADVAGVVAALLGRCPKLTILATSRETLGVPGEVVMQLPPMTDREAQQLFVQRATAAAPGWTAHEDERGFLARLCTGLDHLPLAIELAAAQSRALSIRQLVEHLADRFDVLGGGPRTNQRHASMTAAVAWSYDTLSAAEREVFEALAMLEGTFDLEGATAAAGRRDVMGALFTLIDKSLVVVVAGDPFRYRILETLRQYAALHRTEPVAAQTRARIIGWVCSLADVADTELRGPDSRSWMHRLERNTDTIRAALQWVGDDPTTGLRIASGIYWFWYRRGNIAEGLRALRPVVDGPLSSREATAGLPVPMLIRAAVGFVMLSYRAGDRAGIGDGLVRAGALAAVTDDPAAQAYALCAIGYFGAGAGHTEQALRDADAALRLARRAGAGPRAAEALLAMGMAHLRAGNLAEAQRHLAEASADAAACGYLFGVIAAQWILSKVHIANGDFSDQTVSRLVQVVHDCEFEADLTSWIVVVVALAYVQLRRGRLEVAAELVGIANRQGELIGFSPTEMDPAETLDYQAQIQAAIDTDVRGAAALARGRVVPADQTRIRVRDLVSRDDRPGGR